MTHDEAIQQLLAEYKIADKEALRNLFIDGISRGEIHFGIKVYSAMKHFYEHSFSQIVISDTGDCLKNDSLLANEFKKPLFDRKYISFHNMDKHKQQEIMNNGISIPCHICSSSFSYPTETEYGGNSVYSMLQCLRADNQSDTIDRSLISDESLEILYTILSTLLQTEDEDNIRIVFKKLKKQDFFKRWKELSDMITAEEWLQDILEILGWLGILHTEKHKGAFYEYYNYGNPQLSTHNSDWDYPVDFWRGKYGLDKDALMFWFEGYSKINEIITVR